MLNVLRAVKNSFVRLVTISTARSQKHYGIAAIPATGKEETTVEISQALEETQKESKTCKRCGRKLKSEASKELGFGCVCYRKYMTENKLKPLFIMQKGNTDE
jgi:protein-arginine kinase activator protein McsA